MELHRSETVGQQHADIFVCDILVCGASLWHILTFKGLFGAVQHSLALEGYMCYIAKSVACVKVEHFYGTRPNWV